MRKILDFLMGDTKTSVTATQSGVNYIAGNDIVFTDSAPNSQVAMEQYIAFLEYRADIVQKYIENHLSLDDLESFINIHNSRISALKAGNLILAYEIQLSLYRFLFDRGLIEKVSCLSTLPVTNRFYFAIAA